MAKHSSKNSDYRGRLAPSPTGLLHLGNAWSFLWAWVLAKSADGTIFLRMEDIDPDRSRSAFANAIMQDLQWLGLAWDGEVEYQSSRSSYYNTALESLTKNNYIYPCYCTRKELRALAGAPHVEDMGAPYSGRCAHLSIAEQAEKEASGRRPAMRLRTQEVHNIDFDDAVYGKQSFTLQDIGGDFALRRSDGVIAYQLAVVVDDAEQSVNHILRGNDILVSTPRQIFLQKLLNLNSIHYTHVPLLLDEDGQRLAKRHSALSLQSLREKGVQAERILGLCAYLAGYTDSLKPIQLHELLHEFSLTRCTRILQAQDIVINSNEMAFLMSC